MAETPVLFRDRRTGLKRSIKILILGDYSKDAEVAGPEDICERQLIDLKTYLREKGFNETYLVKDFEDEDEVPEELLDEHFLKKSEHYIEHWADILVFILLKEGDNQSVVREWAHMILKCPEKCNDAILLNHEDVVLRAVLRGDISSNQISQDTFIDENTLHERAYHLCYVKLYNHL